MKKTGPQLSLQMCHNVTNNRTKFACGRSSWPNIRQARPQTWMKRPCEVGTSVKYTWRTAKKLTPSLQWLVLATKTRKTCQEYQEHAMASNWKLPSPGPSSCQVCPVAIHKTTKHVSIMIIWDTQRSSHRKGKFLPLSEGREKWVSETSSNPLLSLQPLRDTCALILA